MKLNTLIILSSTAVSASAFAPAFTNTGGSQVRLSMSTTDESAFVPLDAAADGEGSESVQNDKLDAAEKLGRGSAKVRNFDDNRLIFVCVFDARVLYEF